MVSFLLTFVLMLAQGIPALPGQGGTVSGVVHTASGEPAAGVRVSAMVPPESVADARSGASFVTLAETDDQGRYRLEGIPPGRYYIVAGRVDQPTYYPGTVELESARLFSISPGGAVSSIDFAMMDVSARSTAPFNGPGFGVTPAGPAVSIPIQIHLDAGTKLPVFASGGFTVVRLTEKANNAQVSMSLNSLSTLDFSTSGLSSTLEYRVSVEYLPDGYRVTSIRFGIDDVTAGALKIPQSLLGRTIVAASTNRITLPTLLISLSAVPRSPASGVRVSGRMKDAELRSIYLSGIPGTLFSDGTFEFLGVSPGRHLAAALGSPPARPSLAAIIVVGDRDMEGVELQETSALPSDVKVPGPPGPAGTHEPGSSVPLALLHGRAMEESSGQPIEEGNIKLIGRDRVEVPIGAGGHYEFPRLLPGTYDVEMQIFGHSNIRQSIVVDEGEVNLDLTSRRLY